MHIGVDINIAIKPVTKDVVVQCDSASQDVELQYDATELPQCTRPLEHCSSSCSEHEESSALSAESSTDAYSCTSEALPAYTFIVTMSIAFIIGHESDLTKSGCLRNRQTMYLCFESALLLLFSVCFHCASPAVTIKKAVIGTFP